MSFSQMLPEVKWKTFVEKVSDTEYNLVAIASIPEGYHLYSQDVPEGGPIATSFTFEESKSFTLKGQPTEEDVHTEFYYNLDYNILC